MTKDQSILILGEGRIAQAVAHYLYLFKCCRNIEFYKPCWKKDKIRSFSLIISCLPGEEAPRGLGLALEYQKNLLDVSDLDPPFYLQRKNEIEKRGILVIPGCGFSPGLVNFVVGKEALSCPKINRVIIKAGSLSPKRNFFPFLWCFADLIQEHRLPSLQIIGGKKIKVKPFAGLEKEYFWKIPAETYYCASGFENLLEKRRFQDFQVRVIRPEGFMNFFLYLENYGFLNEHNLNLSRNILESCRENNYTLASIDFLENNKRRARWQMHTFSKKNERLNSMQKITASFPAAMAKMMFKDKIKKKGLFFVEDLAQDEFFFLEIIKLLQQNKIFIQKEG